MLPKQRNHTTRPAFTEPSTSTDYQVLAAADDIAKPGGALSFGASFALTIQYTEDCMLKGCSKIATLYGWPKVVEHGHSN